MRLLELLTEHEFPQIKTHKPNRAPDLYDYEDEDNAYHDDDDLQPDDNPHARNPDVEVLGTGAFASAYRHKDNPHDIMKASKASYTPDGFQALFTALSKDEEAQANPYFPRFRRINKFEAQQTDPGWNEDNRKRSSYIVKVEALEPYKNLSEKEREMLVNKIFNEHGEDVINHYWEEERRDKRLPIDQSVPGQKFAWAIRACLEGDTWEDELRWTIEDKKFEQAIEFLQAAAKEYDYKFDLHRENLMIRRTSVGVQLVLNDPLGFSSGNSSDGEGEIEGHPDWE